MWLQSKANNEWVLATSDYGGDFIAAVKKGNVHAVQFHPEKSGGWHILLSRFCFSVLFLTGFACTDVAVIFNETHLSATPSVCAHQICVMLPCPWRMFKRTGGSTNSELAYPFS